MFINATINAGKLKITLCRLISEMLLEFGKKKSLNFLLHCRGTDLSPKDVKKIRCENYT